MEPYSFNTAEIDLAERATRTADSESVDSNPSQPHSSVQTPVPTRPIVLQRNGSTVTHSKEGTSEYVEIDARAISPRRSSRDIEALIRELRAELSRHAKLLRESLHLIFTRIEAVKTQHDKLDSNNKLIENYIEDLVSTNKAMTSGTHKKN